MTKESFLAFYPQFGAIPTVVIDNYVTLSNNRFHDFGDDAEEGRRLWIAHKLTLYAQTYSPLQSGSPGVAGMSALAGAGMAAQTLSKNVGGVSISKSEGSGVSSISGYGEWKQTSFGLQLISLAKVACGGIRYIP